MKRVYLTILLALLLLIALLYNYFDVEIANYFHNHKTLYPIFAKITKLGQSEYYLIPSILIYFIYRKRDEIVSKYALLLFGSVAISGILADIIKIIVARYRPRLYFSEHLYGFDWFHFGHLYASFPSGHSATAFSAFVAFGYMAPKWRYMFYFIAFLIAFSRVVVGAHYPSDALAGSILGAVTTVLLYNRLFKGSYAK